MAWNVEVADDAGVKRRLPRRAGDVGEAMPLSADEGAAYGAFDMSAEHKNRLMQTNVERVFRLGAGRTLPLQRGTL